MYSVHSAAMGGFRILVTVIFILCNILHTNGQSRICDRVPIHTTAAKTKGDGGFSILVKGLPVDGRYIPGETYSGECLSGCIGKISVLLLGEL